MSGRFQAPATPSLRELNAQALAGDDDALRALVARCGSCESLSELLDMFVPDRHVMEQFDRYCDEFQRARAKALLDTLELPAVTNLNNGWKEAA